MYLTVGLLLVALGIGSYLLSAGASLTALIPAIFGVPLVACGLWIRRATAERRVHIAAAVYSVLGLLAVGPRFLGTLPQWRDGWSLALVAQALLFLSLIVSLRISTREIRRGGDSG